MSPVHFTPEQARAEQQLVHVLWMTSLLGCDGDSIAFTAATSPSVEDLLYRTIPGTPGIAIYNPVYAFESGEDFVRHWYDAEQGKLDPFILVLEGSVPDEELSGDGAWAAFGVDPETGQPIPACAWLDRLAPKAAAVLALGTCAAYGGIPAMRNNPTGAMGLRDYLGHAWRSQLDLPIVNLPGCPVQPDNITETLLQLALFVVGSAPPLDLDDQGRPRWLFERTAHEVCNRAGLADSGDFAKGHDESGCLVKIGCMGPVVKCNVPARGWVGGIGGCPNVGGICIGCTMPGFPDKFLPLMEADRLGTLAARGAPFTPAPVLRYLRRRIIERKFEVEPKWRRRSAERAGAGGPPR
jgi:hydrogenase small subunit